MEKDYAEPMILAEKYLQELHWLFTERKFAEARIKFLELKTVLRSLDDYFIENMKG